MYGSDDYVTGAVTYGRPSSRRKWLAVGVVLAAVLMVLVLVILAFQAGEDELDVPLGAASSPTATPSATPSAEPAAETTDGSAGTGGAANTGSGGGGGGSGDSGDTGDTGDAGDGDTEEPEPPAEPLSIEATIDTVTPGGQCFASGTIAVSGGEYPLTVHYQWRALVIAGGLDGEPVSAVHNVTFTEPGEAGIQTSALPEDGTNVFLVVTGPEPAGSGLVGYDGCSDGPGDIVAPGD